MEHIHDEPSVQASVVDEHANPPLRSSNPEAAVSDPEPVGCAPDPANQQEPSATQLQVGMVLTDEPICSYPERFPPEISLEIIQEMNYASRTRFLHTGTAMYRKVTPELGFISFRTSTKILEFVFRPNQPRRLVIQKAPGGAEDDHRVAPSQDR